MPAAWQRLVGRERAASSGIPGGDQHLETAAGDV